MSRGLEDLSHAQLQALLNDPAIGDVAKDKVRAQLGIVAPPPPPPGPPPSETMVRMEIKAWCKERGAVFVVDNEQNRKTRVTPGLSDLIVFWPDRGGVWFVEVKSRDGKQSKDQLDFEAACRVAGVPYIVARSVQDLEAFARRIAA